MSEGQEFDAWYAKYSGNMERLYEYAKSPLPATLEDRQEDIQKSIHLWDECSRLMADVDTFLTGETKKAVLAVRSDHPDLSAEERKVFVKDYVKSIKRLYIGLEITCEGIKSRQIASFNANRRM